MPLPLTGIPFLQPLRWQPPFGGATVTPLLKTVWRLLRRVLLPLAAVVLLIEEWGWRPLTTWAARLAKWPPWARL